MTLSLLSIAVLLIAALVIILETVRAIGRGLKKTLVTLASVMLAIFLSSVLVQPISNLFIDLMVKIIKKGINFGSLNDLLPSLPDILGAYVDAIISPILFLLLFYVIRGIIALVVLIVMRSQEKKAKRNTKYENEDAPRYKKNSRVASGVIGAICGFLITVVVASPIMGTLKIATTAFNGINSTADNLGFKINSGVAKTVGNVSNDLVGNIFYYSGGNLIYKVNSSSTLNGKHFALENEMINTLKTAPDIFKVGSILSNITASTQEERDSMRQLGSKINEAETLKTVTADILPELATNWLNGDPYNGFSKPKLNKICESVFNKMLYVCKSSDPKTAGDDLSTLLTVYIIAYENGVLISTDYKAVVEAATATGVFDLIKQELDKNYRMSGITVDIDTVSVRAIASAIQSFNLENYDALMDNITRTLNDALMLDEAARVQYVADFTRQYIQNYGINVSDAEVENVAKKLVDEVIGSKKNVTVDDLKEFWDKYSAKSNSTGTVAPQQPILPSDPSIEQEDPTVETEDSSSEQEDPTVETEDPSAEPEDPSIETEEPSIETEEPFEETYVTTDRNGAY